jgi:hypothetical protein
MPHAVFGVCSVFTSARNGPLFAGPQLQRDGQLLCSISYDTVADLPYKVKGTSLLYCLITAHLSAYILIALCDVLHRVYLANVRGCKTDESCFGFVTSYFNLAVF